MSNYKTAFKRAIEITKRLNLKLETPKNDSTESFIQLHTYEDLRDLLYNEFPEFKSGGLALQCATVSFFMKPFVDQYLNCESVITSGYYTAGGKDTFFIDEEKARFLIENKHHNKIIGFHVWLTLPSMEIIDFTLGNSYAKFDKNVPLNEYILNHPNNMNVDSLQFHPVILGEDFLRQTGFLIDLNP